MAKKKKTGKRKPPRKVYQPRRSKIRLFKGKKALLETASELPFVGCWRHRGWKEHGITGLLLARAQDEEHVIYAVYLVDLFCLGIKDAFVRTKISRRALKHHVSELFNGEEEPCDIVFAHQLIYSAIDYARKYGFEPHPDFYREGADKLLEPRGTYPEPYEIEFGKDGKPLYVAGPYDSELFARHVVETLQRTAPEGFDYVVVLDEPPREG